MNVQDPLTRYRANLFLKWEKGFLDSQRCHYHDGYITIVVQKYTMGNATITPNFNKWEIIIGLKYWSRDKERFFDGQVKAMETSEKILKLVAKQLGEDLRNVS